MREVRIRIPKTQNELLQIIEDQHEQLKTLKQAVIRLERKLHEVAATAGRSQEQARRLNEEVRSITRVLTRKQ